MASCKGWPQTIKMTPSVFFHADIWKNIENNLLSFVKNSRKQKRMVQTCRKMVYVEHQKVQKIWVSVSTIQNIYFWHIADYFILMLFLDTFKSQRSTSKFEGVKDRFVDKKMTLFSNPLVCPEHNQSSFSKA